MSIRRDEIIHKVFREVNGYRNIADSFDVFIKLDKRCKMEIKSGLPAFKLASLRKHNRQKFGSTNVNL